MKRVILVLALLAIGGAGVGWYVLITPNNPLTRLFQRQISDTGARIIIGPYPEDGDFQLLQRAGVTTVVTLLNPQIPYEATLLDREKAAAAAHGMALRSFPMSSILGKRFGDDYDRNAAAAAEAIASTTGKVYLHCYLGMHRVQVVRDLLAGRGVDAGRYAVRQGERDADTLLLDAADKDYQAGRYADALASLAKIDDGKLTDDGRLLAGWSKYRSGDVPGARDAFGRVREKKPQAAIGLGYCAYRGGDYADAERQFTAALAALPENADALTGHRRLPVQTASPHTRQSWQTARTSRRWPRLRRRRWPHAGCAAVPRGLARCLDR